MKNTGHVKINHGEPLRVITALALAAAMALSCAIASFADEGPAPNQEQVQEEILTLAPPTTQNNEHIHSWTYTADKDKITAACTGNGDCTYSDNDLSLTISANDGTYNGNSHEANFGNAASFCGGDLPAISYEYKANKDDVYAPVTETKNVGFYKASFTVGVGKDAVTAFVEDYAISPRPLSSGGFSANSKIYDGTTTAEITSGSIEGIIEGDDVSVNAVGSFSDSEPGIAKDVNISFELSGSDASNYSVPESSSSQADITVGEYSTYSGGNGAWKKSSGKDYTLTIKRSTDDDKCFDFFKSVELDGKELTPGTDYTAASGSTVITLSAATLQNLGTGTHKITVNFTDTSISTNLTVNAANGTPNTGDPNNPLLLICLNGFCAAGLGAIAVYFFRKRHRA